MYGMQSSPGRMFCVMLLRTFDVALRPGRRARSHNIIIMNTCIIIKNQIIILLLEKVVPPSIGYSIIILLYLCACAFG